MTVSFVMSVCLSIYLSVSLSICPSICLFVCLSICLFVSLSLSLCLSVKQLAFHRTHFRENFVLGIFTKIEGRYSNLVEIGQ